MNHFAVNLKLTQHCKSPILQKKKESFLESKIIVVAGGCGEGENG